MPENWVHKNIFNGNGMEAHSRPWWTTLDHGGPHWTTLDHGGAEAYSGITLDHSLEQQKPQKASLVCMLYFFPCSITLTASSYDLILFGGDGGGGVRGAELGKPKHPWLKTDNFYTVCKRGEGQTQSEKLCSRFRMILQGFWQHKST